MVKIENYEDRLHYSNVINFLDKKLEIKRKETEEREVFSKIESVEDVEDDDVDEKSVFDDIGVFISMMLLVWFLAFCYLIRV